ncbi:MAG: serine protease [Thermoleophilaceae bacterium]|jgi:membrane-bound serine protease (ClpP class)|nr:serine protease [Thermoleophilaceae bacterium]
MLTLGIALLVAAVVLFVAEAHVPAGGMLGAGGVVALVAGAWIALVAAGAGLLVAVPVAVGTGVVSAAVLALVASKTVRAMRLPTSSGSESLVGRTGDVRAALEAGGAPGQVFVEGALWRAEAANEYEEREALRVGDRVVVERVRGLTLCVRKAEQWERET